MRILLAAHDFPPATSPQSLRWHFLGSELARAGHELVVLTVEAQGAEDTPGWPMRVLRTSRGWVYDLLRGIRARRRGAHRTGEGSSFLLPTSTEGLNWRGLAVVWLVRACSYLSFPDLRGQWNRGARRALADLLPQWRPDVMITSHEPANTLKLGRLARSHGIPWVADLGDPVVAPYTPRRWRGWARRLEREVCSHAALVLTTTLAYRQALLATHAMPPGRCRVLRQGFSFPEEAASAPVPSYDGHRLELLFTGQFYSFRRPKSLLQAIESIDNVRLTVFSFSRDGGLLEMQERLGDKLRILGPIPHADIAAWQGAADVLVNIGNRLPLQVPGKLFEYFGAGRGILHVSSGPGDEAAGLVRERRRGWVVDDNAEDIARTLRGMQADWRDGDLYRALDLSRDAVSEYSWSSLGADLERALSTVAEQHSISGNGFHDAEK